MIDVSVHDWLRLRKEKWRTSWGFTLRKEIYHIPDDLYPNSEYVLGKNPYLIIYNFWQLRGFVTFEQWLMESKLIWIRSYSWNKKKRKKIVEEMFEEVEYPSSFETDQNSLSEVIAGEKFERWLRVRKKQWMVSHRKKQRKLQEEISVSVNHQKNGIVEQNQLDIYKTDSSCSVRWKNKSDVAFIDDFITEEEEKEIELERRPPLDIMYLFDGSLGIPDDSVFYLLTFLDIAEHWKFLCISINTNRNIIERTMMWKSLCPSHWNLPRRPRRAWHVIYLIKIREEEEERRKLSDDILIRAQRLFVKGDPIQAFEKLITKAEQKFNFDINYCSGVVQERNSVLNLAVIEGRHRCAKWLIEKRSANIETYDRGQFTPLLNAAWRGDKVMVRYLLGQWADRTKLGTYHCTQGLAPSNFDGLTAEGWARERGHDSLAALIQRGLG